MYRCLTQTPRMHSRATFRSKLPIPRNVKSAGVTPCRLSFFAIPALQSIDPQKPVRWPKTRYVNFDAREQLPDECVQLSAAGRKLAYGHDSTSSPGGAAGHPTGRSEAKEPRGDLMRCPPGDTLPVLSQRQTRNPLLRCRTSQNARHRMANRLDGHALQNRTEGGTEAGEEVAARRGWGRDWRTGRSGGVMRNSVCGDVRSVFRTVACRATVGDNGTDG